MSKFYKKIKIMMLLLGVFVVCWGFYLFVVIFDILFLEDNIVIVIFRKFLLVLGLVNFGLNWIIFGLKNVDFRKVFIYLFCCGIGVTEDSLVYFSLNIFV